MKREGVRVSEEGEGERDRESRVRFTGSLESREKAWWASERKI